MSLGRAVHGLGGPACWAAATSADFRIRLRTSWRPEWGRLPECDANGGSGMEPWRCGPRCIVFHGERHLFRAPFARTSAAARPYTIFSEGPADASVRCT